MGRQNTGLSLLLLLVLGITSTTAQVGTPAPWSANPDPNQATQTVTAVIALTGAILPFDATMVAKAITVVASAVGVDPSLITGTVLSSSPAGRRLLQTTGTVQLQLSIPCSASALTQVQNNLSNAIVKPNFINALNKNGVAAQSAFLFSQSVAAAGVSPSPNPVVVGPGVSPSPAPVAASPAPLPLISPSPAPVVSPAPAVSSPSPAPVLVSPSPAPVLVSPSPAPVLVSPSPAPVLASPSPAPALQSPSPAPAASPSPSPVVNAPAPATVPSPKPVVVLPPVAVTPATAPMMAPVPAPAPSNASLYNQTVADINALLHKASSFPDWAIAVIATLGALLLLLILGTWCWCCCRKRRARKAQNTAAATYFSSAATSGRSGSKVGSLVKTLSGRAGSGTVDVAASSPHSIVGAGTVTSFSPSPTGNYTPSRPRRLQDSINASIRHIQNI